MKKPLLQQAWFVFPNVAILAAIHLAGSVLSGCASTGAQQQGSDLQQGQSESASSQNAEPENELGGDEMVESNANPAEAENIEGGANGNFAAGNVGTSDGGNELSESINNVVSDDVTTETSNNPVVGANTSLNLAVNANTSAASNLQSNLPPLNQAAPLPTAGNATVQTESSTNLAQEPAQVVTNLSPQQSVQNQQGTAGSLGTLSWVGYGYSKNDKQLQVQIVTEGSPTYRIFREVNRGGQSEIVVRYQNTKLRKKIRRDLDASEFRSPVAYIRMRHDPSFMHTDVVLTLREDTQPTITTKGSSVMLAFEISDKWFAPTGDAKPVSSAQIIEDDAQGLTVDGDKESLPGEPEKKRAAYIADPGKDKFSGESDIKNSPLVPKEDSDNELIPEGMNKDSEADPQEMLQNDSPSIHEDYYSVLGVAQGDFQSDIPSNGEFDTSSLLEDAPQAFSVADPAAPAAGPEVDGVAAGTPAPAAVSNKKAMRLDFRDAPVSQIIRMIANESNLNIVIAPEAGAKRTSISLKNVPWDVALKVVLDANRMGMQEISPGVVRVDFLKTFTEDKETEEKAKQATEALIPTKVLVMPLNYAKAEDAVKLAKEMLPKPTDPTNIAQKRNYDRFKAHADLRSNSVIVEATPNVLATVKILLEKLDSQTPQVRIASRLVEISSKLTDGLGFTWGAPFSFDPGRGLGFGTLPFPNYITSRFSVDTGLPGTAGKGGSAAIRLGSINNALALDMRLKMYEEQNLSETIQTQDVVVQDNETAEVIAGTRDFLAVPGMVGSQGTIQPVEYNLSLKVKPHITADGAVQMKLEIKGDSPGKDPGDGRLPPVMTRHLNTSLLKQSGETAVIGGLYDSTANKVILGVPFLSSIPLIGALFRTTDNTSVKKDLLIMVTPTIIGQSAASSGGSAAIDIPSPGVNAAGLGSNINAEENASSNEVPPPVSNSAEPSSNPANGTQNGNNANSVPANFSNESNEL
jgi:type IV pilus secretin PilQ/predicted competence protein